MQTTEQLRLRWWIPTLLLPAGYLLYRCAQLNPVFTETYFSQGMFPYVMGCITALTGWLPFTLVEWVILFGSLGLITFFVKTLLLCWRSPHRRKYLLLRLTATFTGIFSALYFLFVISCGMNYFRMPFSHFSGLTVRDSSVEELYSLCEELIECTNTIRTQTQEDERGVFVLQQQEMNALAQESHQAFLALGEEYPILGHIYQAPKTVFFSEIMSHCQFLGSFSSYTGEACINVNAPDYNIPEAMCHEQAHMRGFMREDEANFIAYLACTQWENPDFQYSGLAQALIYSMNALYSADLEKYRELRSQYSSEMVLDFEDDAAYWKAHDTFVSKAANSWNDTYLKANSQTDGVKSYGRMVDLLLADYRARHGLV